MSYRRALIARWSRRDRLAVVVVALTIAFLVGTSLLVLAAGDQTARIATEYGTPGVVEAYDSLEAARTAAPPEAAVLPVAAARTADGRDVTVVARTDGGRRVAGEGGFRLYASDTGATSGHTERTRAVRFDGEDNAVTLEVGPRGRTVLDPGWYVAGRPAVERLGVTDALVVDPASAPTPRRGVPLRSVLSFFLLGTREVLQSLSVAAAGAGLLVGVTVYSVTRMTVMDRLATIRVARATGAPPRHVAGVFAVRGALIAGVGAALGYAAGVVLPNAAVNLAVFLGVPTSLAVEVTPPGARLVGAVVAGTLGVGAVSGALAARPAVARPPARLDEERNGDGSRRGRLSPRLLGRETLVPTAATLTAFVIFATLVASMAGAVAPLASTGGATVTEPGATHPIASNVPEAYARALDDREIAASPEILAFAVADGQPFVVRGVDARSFLEVTGGSVSRGRAPRTDREALIGADLARTLSVERGDRLLVGGSTDAAVTTVRVVGIAAAPGAFDDQLLLSLATARHLTNMAPGRVQFVRLSRPPEGGSPGGGENATSPVGVVDVSIPDRVPANATFTAAVTLRNDGLRERAGTVSVEFDGQTRTRRARLAPGTERTLSITVRAGGVGAYRLRVGNDTYAVRVPSPDAIELRGVPARAPPGSEPLVTVATLTGDPVENATVSVGDRTVRTDASGQVRLPLGAAGTRTVTARRAAPGSTANATEAAVTTAVVEVSDGVGRSLAAAVSVSPSAPSLLTEPVARVALSNPWNRTLARTVRIEAPGGTRTRSITLEPGGGTAIEFDLPARPPGSYAVEVTVGGGTIAGTEYAVTGDERIAAAVAESATGASSGIERAVETAFGNLEVVFGVILGLAGLMTAGGSTATFARAVHARRRTIGIYRATGASPARVLRIVLGDALRIGLAATALALVAGTAALVTFEAAGLLAPFGIRLPPVPSLPVAAGIALGALCVSLVGATLATSSLLVASPGSLLADDRGPTRAGASRRDRATTSNDDRDSERAAGPTDGRPPVRGDHGE